SEDSLEVGARVRARTKARRLIDFSAHFDVRVMMQNKPLDLAAVNQAFRALAQRKGWQAYHTPKNLAAAISVEAAELLEIFQWLTDEQSRAVSDDPATRQQVADEAADIVMYIIELCV